MTALFRQIPPWTLILQILSKLRISTEFPCTFQKQDIYLDDSIELVGLLEPYYIPCKAKQFLTYTDANRWIVILRHLLFPHGYVLVIQETTRNTKKAIFYTIERAHGTLKEAVQMDFS